ncbi:MAG: hypothetical protein WA862_03410, partial [Solirubrobacterales bacterium]
MKRLTSTIFIAALAALALATPAGASFGFEGADVTFTGPDGSPALEAGSHPFAMTTAIDFNVDESGQPEGAPKNLQVDLPAGFVADATAVRRCSTTDFLTVFPTLHPRENQPQCPDPTAVGFIGIRSPGESTSADFAVVYNLAPGPGAVLKLGARLVKFGVITINGGVRPDGERNAFASLQNITQLEPVAGSELTLWGNPASPAHDEQRGACLFTPAPDKCPANVTVEPLLTLPTRCSGPLRTLFAMSSWQEPGALAFAESKTHDDAVPPGPLGTIDCANLGFSPTIAAKPTTLAAQSPAGLDFDLDVKDEGLTSPTGLANSHIRKAVVTLPEGFTTNPSLAEGLNVCSEADLERESAFSAPGAGCPNASKIGTVEVETPLLDENVNGALFIAKPYENPFGTLLALYMVIKNPNLGIIVTQALKVETDPLTGRITTTADNLPQLPFSHFRLHFREGTRSPLATPPACGSHEVRAQLTPWSGGQPITTSSTFQIITGPNAGPCPSGGTPPFRPGLSAGTLNNAAGRYSPFNLRLTRNDGEQEYTRFSIKLPPGITGKLAGIPFCPDAAIAAAKARTGPHGGAEELAAPSCPLASEVGRTLVGAGVGPSLAYAPGKVYLAGPYNGSALSIAAITAAKVGPFDLGTVVIRQALKINPETAEVFIDPTGS